jgi:hypothetical protein
MVSLKTVVTASHYKSIAEVLSPYFIKALQVQQAYLPLVFFQSTATIFKVHFELFETIMALLSL